MIDRTIFLLMLLATMLVLWAEVRYYKIGAERNLFDELKEGVEALRKLQD